MYVCLAHINGIECILERRLIRLNFIFCFRNTDNFFFYTKFSGRKKINLFVKLAGLTDVSQRKIASGSSRTTYKIVDAEFRFFDVFFFHFGSRKKIILKRSI